MVKGTQAEVKHEIPEKLKEGAEKAAGASNQFMNDLAALTYYQIHDSKTQFESLPEAERDTWAKMAAGVLVGLDKMNKMVAPKVTVEESEVQRNKNHQILTSIIRSFVEGVKTLRCPKCGSTADSRARLFPCEELAYRILAGKLKEPENG